MGQHSSKKGLEGVTRRAESRVGKIQITGRYHRLPKRLEDDYRLSTKVLGSGYSGQVHLAENIETGAKVAVKGFKLHGVSREKKEELETEAEIFLSMDHPHVARLVDVYESEDHLNLVMECMTGGELFKRVTERKRFSERDAADAAWQMLLALNYIHCHEIVHRDIKLENFLYVREDSDELKLIDFGFSKIWVHNTKMALSCGTLAYVAPEVLDKRYTSQCDLWSFGVVIFIVLFGYMPFSGAEEKQMQNIMEGKFSYRRDIWGRVSTNAQDFVIKLLVVNPKMRLTAEQALHHPWILERERLRSKEDPALDEGIVDALCAFGQASVFRRACMSMMAWSLTDEERSKVGKAFLELDVERTGAITLGEFKEVLEQRFHLNDERIVEAFQALDINHTEEIHYSEFLAAMVSSRIAIHDNLLKATFRRFDTDNSGFITAASLRQVLGETFEGEEVDELLKEADTSHDGRISYPEWIEYLRGGGAHDVHTQAAVRVIDHALLREGNESAKPIRPRVCIVAIPVAAGKCPDKAGPAEEAQKKAQCGCTLQ